MKKTSCTIIVSLAGILIAAAQTETPPTAESAQAAPTVIEATQPAASTPEMGAAATTSTPAEAQTPEEITAANESSPVSAAPEPPPATAAVTAEVAQPAAESKNAAPEVPKVQAMATATNAPEAVTVGIPQIRFSDVPITTAIENLARLANINYMMDPKIGYGQTDANGQVKGEPTLSIRWENVTAENALLALLDNYNLQLVHDKKTGIDRITTKDPTAPPPLITKVIQLKYASVSNMVESVQSVFTDPHRRSKVLADSRTSQLVVVATDPEQVAVEALINQLDKPTRQVLIETRLVEISSNPKTKKGIDWTSTLQGQNVSFGNGSLAGNFTTTFPGDTVTTTDPSGASSSYTTTKSTTGSIINEVGSGNLSWSTKSGTTPSIGFLNADGLNATLSFLNSSSDAQIMSTPRIVTLDNEQAEIQVSRGYPVWNVSAGTANSSGGATPGYTNVGTMLKVTPRISANDYIWLRVKPEISSFAGTFAGPTIEKVALTAPLFDQRKLETQVLIPNSNTLVLGGLVNDNPTYDSTKVPLLGDIPYLGFFFRSESKSLIKANLLIFITPTIIIESDFQPSSSGEFMKTKPQRMKDPMDPTTAWDGPVKKGTWSDPITDTVR